ncbi:MAG: hypothetical protein RL657_2040 [Pseudomonadota bacterium]|jgi:hypothetical protein
MIIAKRLGEVRSLPTFAPTIAWRAAVAQWIEYWPPKPRVVGSIPASRATPHPASGHVPLPYPIALGAGVSFRLVWFFAGATRH